MVQNILKANGYVARNSRNSERVTEEYKQRITTKAAKYVKGWQKEGVPVQVYNTLKEIDPSVITKFRLCSVTQVNQVDQSLSVRSNKTFL